MAALPQMTMADEGDAVATRVEAETAREGGSAEAQVTQETDVQENGVEGALAATAEAASTGEEKEAEEADVPPANVAHSSTLGQDNEWLQFIAESAGESEHSQPRRMTAIEFILQPFPYEKFYVPRGSQHEVVVQVKKSDQFIVWKFEVEDYDIDFAVHFLPTPDRRSRHTDPDAEVVLQIVHSTTRYIAAAGGGRPVEGMHKCSGPGTATLVWDNSYSRLRGKNIQYQVQAVHRNIMDSATAAADAFDEANRARIQREELARAAALGNGQLIVSTKMPTSSSSSYLLDTSTHLYRQLFADKLPSQSWLVSAPLDVAGKLASRLFGSPVTNESVEVPVGQNDEDDGEFESTHGDNEAKSLLEELNGLNMQLLERLESCEDSIAKLTVERDQERSRVHVAAVEKENLNAVLASKELGIEALRSEIQRINREREAWREIQQERDALLEEKHRWAMSDDFIPDEEEPRGRTDLDAETNNRLEHELGQAEATVLRLRAELGYPLTNHLTGTSTRLEKIAREMTATKKQYEDQMKASDDETNRLKQQVVKYRSQKRVLVAEIKNLQSQSEGQIAVAMAEANESRMVNRRLKKQNELLLTQIRSLVDDAREQEKKLQDEVEQKIKEAQLALQKLHQDGDSETSIEPAPSVKIASVPLPTIDNENLSADFDESTVPYTLSAADIALLNGHQGVATTERQTVRSSAPDSSASSMIVQGDAYSETDPYRARLTAFFQAKDPSMIPEIDNMLASYAGVEEMLFESLELKYSFLELNA
ncbi:hypothetical protein Poli38472_003133 [Pythium oligandrum]|uniref:GOLD domain-containing protein n=1 Tax=Pythium oligandrum TaxID=41045 RepID=A0A8K1FFW1_PYTOL|nr:hypothetical protein Poli38472_003133 [Pythium oligandrum]|eukprot:TMW57208.1 hypothetical protein Poli38472_003133 [Pythium oligandrum]